METDPDTKHNAIISAWEAGYDDAVERRRYWHTKNPDIKSYDFGWEFGRHVVYSTCCPDGVPAYTFDMWKEAVASGNTALSYAEWAENALADDKADALASLPSAPVSAANGSYKAATLAEKGMIAKVAAFIMPVARPGGKVLPPCPPPPRNWHAETCSSLYDERSKPSPCDCQGGDYCRDRRGIRRRGDLDI